MMSDISNEPTMEDILSSIKKIISEDSAKVLSAPRPRRGAAREEAAPQPVADPQISAASAEDDILELTETSPEPEASAEAEASPAPFALVSPNAETASRSALDALSALVVKPEVHGTDTLEGLVREMLRPMLREWLDANLPQLVESLVSKEIARITGNSLI
jgi:cell pole-organizing protein PopZ